MENRCASTTAMLAHFPVAAVRGTTQQCPLECLDGRLRVAEAGARPATADRVGLAPAVKLTKLAKRPAPSAPLCAPPPAKAAPKPPAPKPAAPKPPAPKPPAPKPPAPKPPAPKRKLAPRQTKAGWAQVVIL